VAELVNLPLLVQCRYILAWEWLYQNHQYVYLIEDLPPLGRAGDHLMVVATKVQVPPA